MLARLGQLGLGCLGLSSMGLPGQAFAAGLGGSLAGLLIKASDTSLDKLARPGAFYNDPETRIALPLVGGLGGSSGGSGLGGALGSVLGTTSKLGLTDGLVRAINDAAGVAAGEAKPIFRTAINNLSLSDAPDIVKNKDGATRYLRTSAGDELHGKLRPLVDGGLAKAGAYRQLDSLQKKSSIFAKAGITRDALGRSVTEQALNGIFGYIGKEEMALRDNPLGAAGGLLNGLLGND